MMMMMMSSTRFLCVCAVTRKDGNVLMDATNRTNESSASLLHNHGHECVFLFVCVLDVKWNKKANDKNCVTVWLSAYQCSFIEKY